MKNKILALVMSGILAASVLTGCGNNNSTGSSADSEVSDSVVKSSGEETQTEDTQDDELAQILKRGTLRVGVEGTYVPYTYHDESGELTGFDVDVAKAIAAKLGVEAEFTEAAWDSLLAGVDSGRLDTVINAVSITDERKEKYDFGGPYFYIAQQVVVKKGNDTIKEWADLNGKKVATQSTSTSVDIYKEAGAELVAINTADEAASMVSTGRADFCSFNTVVFNSYLKEHPDADLQAAFSVPDSVDEYGVPVKKGETRLLEAIQQAIDELAADGTLTQISMDYFGEDFTKPIE